MASTGRVPGARFRWVIFAFLVVAHTPGEVFADETETAAARARRYVEALSKESGDIGEGRKLFEKPGESSCAGCHSVDGRGGKAGPDLLGVGDKYDRAELGVAILSPSRDILPGYATTVAVQRDGSSVSGILRRSSPEGVEIIDAKSKVVRVTRDELARLERSEISLMPERLHEAFTPREFASLVRYLETLTQEPLSKLANVGMPGKIDAIETPLRLEPVHSDEQRFDKPVWISAIPGERGAFIVLEHRRARIWLLQLLDGESGGASARKTLFADLSREVSDGPWEGLVAIAFHPDFRENRRYFLKHEVIEQGKRSTIVVERALGVDFRSDSGKPSRRLLAISQPADNHNGGTLAFGPDGYLYIAMGDGGPQEDPNGYSQNLGELLGSFLRIDIDRREGGLPYAIPPTNPWAGSKDPRIRREVWATGLREPWRFSFDSKTGDLWLGDVGQNRFEEVAIVRGGENHGWNVYEGFVPFKDTYRRPRTLYVPPVFAYGRKLGVSVTGGHVYRGRRSPSFDGVYIFGDFESKRIWGLRASNRRLERILEIGRSPMRIASFGVDVDGELYLVGYEGLVYRIVLDQSEFR